jgi:two-component system C4-dicarboxylate transport sensor histidine kinase DctB
MREGKGSYLGVAPGGDRVRYYLSERVLGHGIIGIAVVRIEFDALEAAWQRGGERVLVTDANGNVFLSSDPLFKYRRIIPPRGTPHAFADPDDDPGYPNSRADPIEIAMVEDYGETAVVRVKTPDDASSYIYQSLKLPDSGWTIHRLADMSTVHQDQRDGAIIGGAVSALVISLLLYLLQRQRAYLAERNAGVRLKEEVAERTQELSEANASLRTEIEERRRTEARLRAMQNELVQAGKLAALGQMSAAIAHEINQPLAAIRTFMASTRIFAKRGDNAQVASNLDLINDLAERMANITAHLKTFARKS